MRPLPAIGVTFIAAVVVDIGLSLLRPSQWLPIPACAAVGDYGTLASLVVVPGLLIFAPVKTLALRSLTLRALLAVMLSWFLIVEFRMFFSLPALREMARLRNDHDYDGVGGNAAVLVGGWILPSIITIIMVVVKQSRRACLKSHGSSTINTAPESIAVNVAQIAEQEVAK